MCITDSFTTQTRRLLFTRADNAAIYLQFNFYVSAENVITCIAYIQLVYKVGEETKTLMYDIPYSIGIINGGGVTHTIYAHSYIFRDGHGVSSDREEKHYDMIGTKATSIYMVQAQLIERVSSLIMEEYYEKASEYFRRVVPIVMT